MRYFLFSLLFLSLLSCSDSGDDSVPDISQSQKNQNRENDWGTATIVFNEKRHVFKTFRKLDDNQNNIRILFFVNDETDTEKLESFQILLSIDPVSGETTGVESILYSQVQRSYSYSKTNNNPDNTQTLTVDIESSTSTEFKATLLGVLSRFDPETKTFKDIVLSKSTFDLNF